MTKQITGGIDSRSDISIGLCVVVVCHKKKSQKNFKITTFMFLADTYVFGLSLVEQQAVARVRGTWMGQGGEAVAQRISLQRGVELGHGVTSM